MISAGREMVCAFCNEQKAIYKCPRCSTQTCSLRCSKNHKALQSCSGERDKTVYVPMNQYGWGTMADDYTYLEEIGRKATEWGREIVKGSYLPTATQLQNKRRDGNVRRRVNTGKRDILQMQLAIRDIDMEFMPSGMEKHRLNQSTWDVKTKSILMTVEFIFNSTSFSEASSDFLDQQTSFSILTHRNKLTGSIEALLRQHSQNRQRNQKHKIPEWVDLMYETLRQEEQGQLAYFITQPSDSVENGTKVHHKLNSTLPLMESLINKTFVEYPTIEIWEEGEFKGSIVDQDGTYKSPVKQQRRKLVRDNQVMKNLIGVYGRNEADIKDKTGNILTLLGAYIDDDDTQISGNSDSGGSEADEKMFEDIHEMLKATDQSLLTQNIVDLPIEEAEGDGSDNWEKSGDEEE